jgi:hypothetical protein
LKLDESESIAECEISSIDKHEYSEYYKNLEAFKISRPR